MGTSGIPRALDDITPEWLTGALREGGAVQDATVTALSHQIIGAGAGFLGQLSKMTLTYDRDEPGAPATVIAKLPTLDPGGRQISNLLQFYEREIRFYRDVAPNTELSVPRAYYTAMDVEGDEYLLLLQDMAPATVGDETAGISVEQVELAVRRIAEFQAVWWNSPELDRMTWMPAVNAPVQQLAAGAYQQAWEPFCQMFGDRVPPSVMALGEGLRNHVVDVQSALEPAPRTIIHGDFRGDNVFYGDGVTAPDFSVIDWQISSKGRGVFDLAYFLSTSITPEARKAHEQRLVRLWHEIISDRADTKGYTVDDAFDDYRIGALFMHVYTVVALGTLDSANERGVMLFNEWLRRRSIAIDELACHELTARVWGS